MGNIVEKIGAMIARLGTKLANNYGGSVSNRYIVLHAPAGTNNERLDPNCAMSLGEFAQVLGVNSNIILTISGQTKDIVRGEVWVLAQSANGLLDFIKPGFTESDTVVANMGHNSSTPYTLTFDSNTRNTIVTYTGGGGNLIMKKLL